MPDLIYVRQALEASWGVDTSYRGVQQDGNPALGQCYPTSRTVQYFFPDTEIIKGKVWNGKEVETHFWNGLLVNDILYHIDLTWQQFPAGSLVREYAIVDRYSLGDSEQTIERCALLTQRVLDYLKANMRSSSQRQ